MTLQEIIRRKIRNEICDLEKAINEDEGAARYMQIASKVVVLDEVLQELERLYDEAAEDLFSEEGSEW